MKRRKFDDIFKSTADLFKVLAHHDRLRILGMVAENEMDVMHLCEALDISQSSASQHLKQLKVHHLLSERREGKRVFYKLKSQLIKNVILSALEIHTQDLSQEVKSVSLFKEMKSLWNNPCH